MFGKRHLKLFKNKRFLRTILIRGINISLILLILNLLSINFIFVDSSFMLATTTYVLIGFLLFNFPFIKFLQVPFIGLCNIIARREIVKELLQQHANPQNISAEIIHLLDDKDYRNNMIAQLKLIREKLAKPHTDLTKLIIDML